MKAKFDKPQAPVRTIVFGEKTYVFLCLNGAQKEDEETKETYYEYDYAEFSDLTAHLDLDDIWENPEKYMDYTPAPEGDARIRELEEKVRILTEEILNQKTEN